MHGHDGKSRVDHECRLRSAFLQSGASRVVEIVYYIPVIVFGLWMVYGAVRYGDPRAPGNLKHPERALWSPSRYYDDNEWTTEGLRVRRAWTRHTFVGALLGLLAILVVKAIDRPA